VTYNTASDMLRAAKQQAVDRARREGKRMTVYQVGQVWYVRSDEEGAPEHATVHWTEPAPAPTETP
jgi:hypothetical protein